MTPREIVDRAIRFQRPERLPVNFGCFGATDFAGLPVHGPANFVPVDPSADEWGCIWAHTDTPNMGQVKGNPLADISRLDSYPFPRFDQDERYRDIPAVLEAADKDQKFVMAGIFMVLFERMHTLHGFEATLADLVADRPAMEALADRVADAHVEFVHQLCRRFPNRVNAWIMSDDWGTQQAAFVSFDFWMDFFFPRYKRLFDAMHSHGCLVMVHSCGKVNEILEGYIRAGVNSVNLQQPRALGIEEVGRRYRGRLTFESLADIQHTLPTGNREAVQADADALMAHWADPRGGFIFSDYGDDRAIGVPDAGIKLHMYRCFSRHSERIYGQPLPEPKLG